MKTTFPYLPGIFKNPGPVKFYLKKTKSKILNINYIQMRRKIIDDYCLLYQNDLPEIQWTFK